MTSPAQSCITRRMTTHRISLALSATALVVALTGAGAIAASQINGASIKRGTIPADRLTANARATLKGKTGPAGPRGFSGLDGAASTVPGPQGPAGLGGANGGFDPAKVIYVTGADVAILSGQIGSATAACPFGTVVVGGGGFNSITANGASGPLGGGTGWFIVVNNESLITINVHAIAVCAAK